MARRKLDGSWRLHSVLITIFVKIEQSSRVVMRLLESHPICTVMRGVLVPAIVVPASGMSVSGTAAE